MIEQATGFLEFHEPNRGKAQVGVFRKISGVKLSQEFLQNASKISRKNFVN